MKKTVIFDLFGVVFSRGLASSIDDLARLFGRDRDQITKAYTRNEAPFDRGDIDEQEFWQRINSELHTSISHEVLSDIVISSYRLNHNMIQLARYLRRGLHVVVYSNFRRQWFDKLDKLHGVSSCFNEVYLSSDFGILKPSHEVFDLVAQRTNTDPDNIALIDDSPRNIQAIDTWGGHGVHFTSPYTAEIQLRRKLGFEIPPYDAQYMGLLLQTKDGALILQRGDVLGIGNPQQLTAPGSLMRLNESAVECGIRELREALGIRIKPEQMHHLLDLSCPFKENQWIRCTFFQVNGVDVENLDLPPGKQIKIYQQGLASEDSDLTDLTHILLQHLASE